MTVVTHTLGKTVTQRFAWVATQCTATKTTWQEKLDLAAQAGFGVLLEHPLQIRPEIDATLSPLAQLFEAFAGGLYAALSDTEAPQVVYEIVNETVERTRARLGLLDTTNITVQ